METGQTWSSEMTEGAAEEPAAVRASSLKNTSTSSPPPASSLPPLLRLPEPEPAGSSASLTPFSTAEAAADQLSIMNRPPSIKSTVITSLFAQYGSVQQLALAVSSGSCRGSCRGLPAELAPPR